MDLYAIVEFTDGVELIPLCWITEDKKHAYWPSTTKKDNIRKYVQRCTVKMDNWQKYKITKILATASK